LFADKDFCNGLNEKDIKRIHYEFRGLVNDPDAPDAPEVKSSKRYSVIRLYFFFRSPKDQKDSEEQSGNESEPEDSEDEPEGSEDEHPKQATKKKQKTEKSQE